LTMSSFFCSPPSSFSSSSSSELSFFLEAAAFFPVETFDYFLDVFLGGSSSSESSSEELAAFLAATLAAGFPLVGKTLTSSSLDSSSSDELAAFLATGFPLTGAAATFPFGLISSESSESSESSLDSTFFLLTTAVCLSPFLACLSVPLFEAFDATLSLFPATASTFLAGALVTGLASESSESPDELSESAAFFAGTNPCFLGRTFSFSDCFFSLFFNSSASTYIMMIRTFAFVK